MQPKRIITILLVVALALFGALAASAAGGSELEITVDMVPASGNRTDGLNIVAPGDVVDVSVTIENNPGIYIGTFNLEYDPEVMEPVMDGTAPAYTKGDNFASFDETASQFSVKTQTITKDGVAHYVVAIKLMDENLEDFTTTGKVATVSFKILEDVECGDATVALYDTAKSFFGGISSVPAIIHDANEEHYNNATAYFHNYGEAVPQAATCTQPAKSIMTCATCQDTVEIVTGSALGHDYVPDVTEPTCNSGGYTTYTCSRNCGEEGHTYIGDYTGVTSHDYKLVSESAADCVNGAYKNYECNNCHHKYTAEVSNALGHEYTSAVEPSTCTKLGYTTITCLRDGCNYQQIITATEFAAHDYKAGEPVAPTCLDQGYTVYTCTECGDFYYADFVAANDHEFVKDEVNSTDSTCNVLGQTIYACKNCDATKVETATEYAAHDHKAGEPVASTCTELGYTVYTCVCGDNYTVYETEFAAHDHKAGEPVASTCTELGYTVYTCVCGDNYTVYETEFAAHDYKAGEPVAPTCLDQGYTVYTCVCGDFYLSDIVEATGHDYDKAITAPTCTTAGYTVYTCACGETYTADYVDALGHDYANGTVITAPTCTEEGYTTKTCAICGNVEKGEYRDAKGHDYKGVSTGATCTADGFTVYTCQVDGCGGTYKVIDASKLDHTYVAGTPVAATCKSLGYTEYKCACGASYKADYVAALPHDYAASVTAPTCTTAGYTTYTCKTAGCGANYVGDYKDANGHDYNVATTAPTCTTMGYTTYTCKVDGCGYKYVADYVDAKGHAYDAKVSEPTCTVMGYTTYTCSVCADKYIADYVDAKGHTATEIAAVEATYGAEGATKGEKCSVCDTVLDAPHTIAKKSATMIIILIAVVIVFVGVLVAFIIMAQKQIWIFKKK